MVVEKEKQNGLIL